MKRIIALFVSLLVFPPISMAAEPAWWTQMKNACISSGGRPVSNYYNDWVAGGGCVCPGSTKGSGQPTCSKGSGGGSSSSGATSSGDLGRALGAILGNAIGEALRGDPEADARRNAEAAAQAARAAEAQRRAEEERFRLEEEKKAKLLGTMMGVSDSPQLGLMGVDSGPGLSLMTDSASAIAPSAKAVPPAGNKSSSYTKGFEHASQCISQNSGSACAGVTADQQQACVADYRVGYDLGSKQKKLVLQEAYQAGHSAGARGELANADSDPRALGPCRTDWIMAYNNGHFGAKAPSLTGTKPARATVDTRDPEVVRIINEMNALAKRLGWSVEEQGRLNKALNSMGADGTQNVTRDEIRSAWQGVIARGQDGDIARKAAQGDGPGLIGAGKQSFEDCAIFALANASGLPYSVVAARATKLIGEGGWRAAAERANPQKTIEQKGLIGGEVAMLAEAIGQVEMVPSTAFAQTLKQGRPVMVNVVPQDGNVNGGHQVVLTKAFQHRGETWYEIVDSNQGPQRRLYFSSKELGTVLQENGVAFRPEAGTTTKLLR
jgi:hypothetical protein